MGAKGSVPRDVGTSMRVFSDHLEGTIGGGALEWDALATARGMLEDGTTHQSRSIALGPALGQCCGGAVTLEFTAGGGHPELAKTPVWIWGAGHVGRALVQVLAPLPETEITWVDIDDTRFPSDISSDVIRVPTPNLAQFMRHAPQGAHHFILTYSHAFDLELCHAALSHGFAFCGLIGSATKWARFSKRLNALGHEDAAINAITCPIGEPALGKHPQAIAIGVARRYLSGDA